MSRAWYTVDDLPPVGGKAAAWCPPGPPVVTEPVSSSMGLVRRVGALNQSQPSPHPAATPPISFDPGTVPSDISPDVWTPIIYVTYPTRRPDCVPVPIRHHNNMPVPAGAWVRTVGQAMKGPKLTKRRQTPWPRSFQRFPFITPVPRDG